LTTIEQGGAIAFQVLEGAAQFLLVTAKRAPQEWIFPKGHVEPGETAAEAAARELREEGGVEGRLLGYVGDLEFDLSPVHVKAKHYLFECLHEVEMSENRERRWCSFEEALTTLSFSSARALLAAADRMIGEKEASAP
jgi:8-oxo-dGTP pyrophosphatase MutT (NUDIX family)